MVHFTVKANVLTLAPFSDIPVFFTTDTECTQCSNCHQVFTTNPTATYDPCAGHICETQLDTSTQWTNWGLGIKDPGPIIP